MNALSSPVGFDPGLFVALAERCEAATRPDRQLDYAIIKAVGYANDRPYSDEDAWRMPGHFTASIDAAMTLVPEGWEPLIDWTQRNPVIAEIYGDGPVARGANPNAALALCSAALRARAALTPPSEPTEK